MNRNRFTTYQLLEQSVVQATEIFPLNSAELFEVTGVPSQLKQLESKDLKLPSAAAIEVALAYPTEKKQKIKPLRETITSYIKLQEKKMKMPIKIGEFFFKVKDTGVGEQPVHPEGYIGALNRIKYIHDALQGSAKWEQLFHRPHVKNFHRVIILSLESDLHESSDRTYDKPNVVFYEYFTGHFVAGMGNGPGVQTDILQLARRLRVALFNNAKQVTYGKVLQALFPELNIDHADWHGIVCHNKQCNRAYFISGLCKQMDGELTKFFDEIFKL